MHDYNNPYRPIGDATLNFDGSSRQIPNHPALNFSAWQDFTIAFKVQVKKNEGYLMDKGHGRAYDLSWSGGIDVPISIDIRKNGELAYTRVEGARSPDDGNSGGPGPGPRVDDGRFHHIVIVRRKEGASVWYRWFLDGRMYGGRYEPTPFSTQNSLPLVLGRFHSAVYAPGQFFRGAIGNLSFYQVGLTDEQIYSISAVNRPPVAHLGAGRVIVVGEQIRVNAGAASDLDDHALTYSWELQTPAGSKAKLDNPTSPTPAFTPDRPGDYTLRLVASDGVSSSLPATVTWVAAAPPNHAPVAHIADGGIKLVAGQVVMLDGRGTTDADNDAVTLTWNIVERPEGSAASIPNAHGQQTSFKPDLPGTYVAELSAFDGRDTHTVQAEYVVEAANERPIVSTSPNGVGVVGEPIELRAEAKDPEGNSLTYRWTLSKPKDSEASLDDPNAASPSFVPDVPGPYIARLVVSDGKLETEATVIWNANAKPAPVPQLRLNYSENVLAETLAKFKLGKDDAQRVLDVARELDDGNRYLKREELEAAAEVIAKQDKVDVGAYRFSDDDVAAVLAKYELGDKAALLHEAVSHDEDKDRYLNRSELESAAAALVQRKSSLTGRRWSDKVLAEVMAKYKVDRDALLIATVRQREHDRYFSREELEAAAKSLRDFDAKVEGGSGQPVPLTGNEAFAKLEIDFYRVGSSLAEYVRLVNQSTEAIDLKGLTVVIPSAQKQAIAAGTHIYKFETSTIVEPQDHVLISAGARPGFSHTFGSGLPLFYSIDVGAPKNYTDVVELRDGQVLVKSRSKGANDKDDLPKI